MSHFLNGCLQKQNQFHTCCQVLMYPLHVLLLGLYQGQSRKVKGATNLWQRITPAISTASPIRNAQIWNEMAHSFNTFILKHICCYQMKGKTFYISSIHKHIIMVRTDSQNTTSICWFFLNLFVIVTTCFGPN